MRQKNKRRKVARLGLIVFVTLAGCAGKPAAGPEAAGTAPACAVSPTPPPLPSPRDEQKHYGHALTRFLAAPFVGSWHCASCHSLLMDRNGQDMSIAGHWRSTMMANASKDPFWRAKVRSEVARHPELQQVIEEKCVSCHMPMAWRLARQGTDYGSENGPLEAFLDPTSDLHAAALDGVSCSLCHQIQDTGLGRPESYSGKFVLDRQQSAPDRFIFGPYRQTIKWPMRTSLGYTPDFGSHTNDSALCATCHTLYTPYVNGNGQVTGQFPEQMVYLEWLHSAYAEPPGHRHNIDESVAGVRICQECHMPHSEAGGVIIANYAPPEVEPKDHFSRHHFVGGNTFMLSLMQDQLQPLGLTASVSHLEATRERTRRQLQEQSARLSLTDWQKEDDALTVTIRVENLVGHKFPTGFPSRRTWLHLMVRDAAGKLVFESGRPEAGGKVAGDDANQPGGFEPHYDLITEPNQVQIYEAVMGDTEGAVTYTLLRGSGYLKDNRLLPTGFDKETAAADIGVYGQAAADDDFRGGGDLVTYRIATGGRSGPFAVRAELLYASLSFPFIRDLSRDDHLEDVSRFARSYRAADKTPVVVAAGELCL